MIRTAWYALVLVASSALHASAAIVAALLRVSHRPGGVYDWATVDWSRDNPLWKNGVLSAERRLRRSNYAYIFMRDYRDSLVGIPRTPMSDTESASAVARVVAGLV